MNHVYYQTKTKYTNTGDALINKSLIETLRNYSVIHANCTKDIPNEFINELGIKPDEKIESGSELSFVLKVAKHAIKCLFTKDKIFIFSGLGHTYGNSFRKIIRNLLTGLVLFPFYRLLGVTITRIGISIGPVSHGLAFSEFIRSWFISNYLVRDSQTLQLCHRIGIKKAKLCPDLSWIYMPHTLRQLNRTNIVTVNLRNSTLDEYIHDEYINSLTEKCIETLHALNVSMKNNMKIIVTYQVKEDKEFSHQLYNKLRVLFPTEKIIEQMTLETAAQIYNNAAYNISNRMHSLLLAYKFGALSIPLIDQKEHIKISSAYNDSQLDSMIINIFGKTAERINLIIKNRQQLYDQLCKIEDKNSREIIRLLENILIQQK